MNSQEKKAEILPLNRSKNKKYAKAYKKEQCYDPTTKYNAGIQSCTIKGDMTTNDSILSSTPPKAIRKRKANENLTSRKTKIRKIKCKSTIIQEPDAVISLLDTVSDSGSFETSETESYSAVQMSPSNRRTVKKNNTSELCNENILSVPDTKLHQLSFSVQPKSPVVYIPLISKIPNSDMSVISTESNLDINETCMPSSLENDLPETGINNDMIIRSSTSFENENPVVESLNSSTDSELFLHSSTNDNEQTIVKTSLESNNINPIYYDIIALLASKLNEVKDSKENFICNQLKIKPIIKHEKFNYNDSNAFNIALDFSTLKAANDYIKEISSVSDISSLSSDVILENSDTWQNSLVKPSGFTPDLVNFICGDSNGLNTEKVKSAISVNSYNENLSHDLDDCSQGNLNNGENFLLSQDLNVDSNEINKENSQNLCEGVDLLTEDNIENSDKLCATGKRRKKKTNRIHRKRGRESKINSVPKVNGLLNEISYYDETEIGENIDIVPADTNELVHLNSASSSAQSLTKKIKLNTVTENKDNENHNAIKSENQKLTCMIEAKCMDSAKNTKGNLESISQNLDEDVLSFDKCDETEQCSKDQAKHCLLENSIDTGAFDKISCYNSSQLSTDCNKSYSGEKFINPKLLSKKSDNLEINKTNLRTKCNMSQDEKNTTKLGLTAEGKEFKLLEGLIVGLEKLDEDTLNKYCAASNIQEKDNYPSTQHENNQIVVDFSTTELSYSNSDTLVPSDGLQKEVELHSSKEVCKKKNLDLNEHLRSPKKSKPLHKSKKEKNRSVDLEVCKISKHNLKIKFRIKNAPEKSDISLTGSEKNPLEALRSKNEGEAVCDIEINNNSETQCKANDSSDTEVPSSNEKLNSESEQKLSNESASISKEKNLIEVPELDKHPEKHSKSDDLSNTASTVCRYESSNVIDKQSIACLKSKKKVKCTSDLVLNKRPKRNLKTDSDNKNIPLHEKDQKIISPKHKIQNVELIDLVENHLQNNSSKPKTVTTGEQVDISFENNVSVLESNADTSVSYDRESNIHQQNNIKIGSPSKKTVTAFRKKTVAVSSDTQILSSNKKLNTESERKLSNETLNTSKEENVTGVSELDKHLEDHSKSDDLSDTVITVCGYESSNVTDKQNITRLKSKKKEKCTSDLVLNKRPKRNLKIDSSSKNIPLHEKDQKMISPKHKLQHIEFVDLVENHLQNNASKPKTVSPEEQVAISLEKNVSVSESNADTSVSYDRESNIHQQNTIKIGSPSKKNVTALRKKTVAISSDTEILSSNKKLNTESEQKLSNQSVSISKEKNLIEVPELDKHLEKHSKSDDLSNTASTVCGYESRNVTDKQSIACLKSNKKVKCTSDLVLNKRPKRNLKTDSDNKNIPLQEKDQKISPKHKIQNVELNDLVENHLQNNSSKPKTVSTGEQVDISFEKNVSVLESNADTSVSSDRESNIHQQNNMKTGSISKKAVTALRKKTVAVSSDTKIQSANKKLNTEFEQKLSNETVSISKERNCTGVSELNKLPEEYSKSDNLSNTASTLCEYELSNVTDKQSTVCLKFKKKEKCMSDLVLNKRPKRNLKTDSSNKNILLHEKEQKLLSPKHKLQHIELDDPVEDNLQNNSSKPKTVSPEEQVAISFENNVSVIESNTDRSVSSDTESFTRQQNNIISGHTSKTTVTARREKAVILSDKKTQSFEDCLAYTEVNGNEKNKTNNASPKKPKEVKSSKNVGNASKIKVSRKQANESSKSLRDSVTFSDTDKKESNCKIKGSNKINMNVQNSIEKSINKLDSRIASPKSCNSNSVSQELHEKNFNMCITDSDSGNTIKVKSMVPIPKRSDKKKTEKAAPDINHNKDLKEEPVFKSPYAKPTMTNSSKVQCSTSQTSYFEDNFDDTLSLKSVGKTSTVILMNDDYLDFEPDQSDFASMSNNESSCSTTDEINEAPVSEPDLASNSPDFEESESSNALKDSTIKGPYSILSTNHCKSFSDPFNLIHGCNYSAFAGNDLITEEDTDSDDDHSFKRARSERKDNDGNETSLDYVDLNNWKESDAVLDEVLQKESEQSAPNTSLSSLGCESLKSPCDDEGVSLNSDQINSLKPKEPAGSVAHLTDVLSQIQDLCFKGLFNEALERVKTYFPISSSDINQFIFQHLLVSTFSFISKSDKMDNSFIQIFDEILELMCHFNICNKKIASYFIAKCCLYPDLNIYLLKLFRICHKENIPLHTKAVKALSNLFSISALSLSEEISFDLMLDFMNYTKLICKKNIHKELLHLALKKCEILDLPFSDIHHICSLLHGITSKEVEEQNLKDFILLIIKKNMWQHVAEMFIAWGTKNCLAVCIYTALTTDYKTMGKYFKKFANYVHEKEGSLCPELKDNLTPELKARFGQMGTALMLNAFSKNAMDTALDILYILHTYNVNYFELQLSMSSFLLTESNLEAENFSFKIFPFSVVFTAIDICLHLNRPIDAFTIFQGYSWIEPDESLDEAVKIYVTKGKCERLLKLVSLFNNEDSLDKGFEPLQNLLTIVKQDFAYEILKENVCDLVSIYNEYLVSLMNAEKLSSVYILYEYSLGPRKDIFTIFPDVFRGLIVTFSEDGRDTVANSLFLLGIMKKIYPLQKPKLEHFPWEITLMTHWTITEIKLAVEWFIKDLFSLLMEKPKETHFENWFSFKIVFDIKDQSSEGLKCLKDTISEPKYYITKTKTALENMNPSIEVTEDINENALYIKSNSLYNFWKSRCPDQVSKFISVDMQFLKVNDTFSFGSNRRHSKERESSIFVKTFLNETCSLSQSSDKMIEPQNLIQSSPSNWEKTSATDVYEMIHEIKANTPPLSYVATTPEHSPSGQNSVHNIPQSEIWLSDPIFSRNEQIDEFQYPPQSPTVPPNQLTEGNCTFTSKSQQATFSDVNQSITNNDITNNSSHFQSHFTPCSSNISPRTSNVLCNSPPSDFKSKELVSKNNGEKNGSSSSKISILKTSVATSQSLVSSKKASLLRSRTISVNKTPVRVKKIATIKKGKILKTNNSSKKFQNFKVCITPGDRTVSSPSIQSSPVELQSLRSNLEESINSNIQEKPRPSFNEDMPVSNTPCNQTLPVVSKTTHSDAKIVAINFTDAGSGALLSSKVSDSNKTLVKLPVSKVKRHKQELVELPVSSQTTLKSTKSPVQSVTSPLKSKFVKTVNLKNISDDKFNNISLSTSLQNCKKDQPKSKPVINRNSTYYSPISKTSPSVTSTDRIASVATGSGETVMAIDGNEKTAGKRQNFDGNEVFTNCTPVIGRLNWNEEESKKVTQFLKAKVAFKYRDLSPRDQNKKVLSLFQAFIESNEGITGLDKRTMKLLTEFANHHV